VVPIELPQPPLADDEIVLRSPREGDVAAITAACQDPLIARFTLVPSPYSEQDAREWLQIADSARARGDGVHFAIATRKDDAYVGSVGLNRIDWDHRVGQIGYLVAPQARRRGVATRAVRLLAEWALHSLDLGRVEIRVDVENSSSQAVAEAAGFVREGVLRSRAESRGRRWDEVMFSLLPADLGPDRG
jgi:RimJ/RimL family protein N-acetyltransferase